MPDNNTLSLSNIAGGALPELFEVELNKVLENINNPNTSHKVKRKISFTLTFLPDDTREIIETEITSTATLAPIKGVSTKLLLEQNTKGELNAVEFKSQMRGQVTTDEILSDEQQDNIIDFNAK